MEFTITGGTIHLADYGGHMAGDLSGEILMVGQISGHEFSFGHNARVTGRESDYQLDEDPTSPLETSFSVEDSEAIYEIQPYTGDVDLSDKPFTSGVTDFDDYFNMGDPPFGQGSFENISLSIQPDGHLRLRHGGRSGRQRRARTCMVDKQANFF